MGDRVGVTSTGALFARVVGELDERGSRCLCTENWRGELEPSGFSLAPQIDAFRIDACHPPTDRRAGEQMPGVTRDRVRMIFIHMLENTLLRRRKRAGVAVEHHVAAFDPPNLSKTGNEVGTFEDNAVETEVAKTGVDRAGRMMGGEPREATRVIDRFSPPNQGEARPGQRVGVTLGGVEKQGYPRIEGNIAAMLSEIGEQQERACIEIGGEQNERRVRGALQVRGQRRALACAQQAPAKSSRIAIWATLAHRPSEPRRRGRVKGPQLGCLSKMIDGVLLRFPLYIAGDKDLVPYLK
jgi:hypothetical protein